MQRFKPLSSCFLGYLCFVMHAQNTIQRPWLWDIQPLTLVHAFAWDPLGFLHTRYWVGRIWQAPGSLLPPSSSFSQTWHLPALLCLEEQILCKGTDKRDPTDNHDPYSERRENEPKLVPERVESWESCPYLLSFLLKDSFNLNFLDYRHLLVKKNLIPWNVCAPDWLSTFSY